MTARQTDLLDRLAAADPVAERAPETADERREAAVLLDRVLATPVAVPARRRRRGRAALPRPPRLAFVAAAAVVLASMALIARDILDSGPGRDAVAARAYATVTDPDVIFHSVSVMTSRIQGPGPDEIDQTLVETWASGRGDGLRQVIYSYEDGRRGKQEFERGFDRRGGFVGGGGFPVGRSVVDLSDGPGKAESVPGGDGRRFDPTAAFKKAYKTGRVRFEGERVLRGRAVYVLVVDHPPERNAAGSGSSRGSETFVVDRRSYLPIEVRASGGGVLDGERFRTSVVHRFQVYEKLPRTPENLAALQPSEAP